MSSSTPAIPAPATPEVAALEAELVERRAHLSTTIDELVTRLQPQGDRPPRGRVGEHPGRRGDADP